MSGRPKATGQLWLERRNTSLQLIELLALVALEVMVMSFPSDFIPGRIARDLNGFKPALLHQRLNVSIDSGFAEGGMMALRSLQNFVWREWPVSFEKGIADRSLLPCLNLSFHGKRENTFSFPCYQDDLSEQRKTATLPSSAAAAIRRSSGDQEISVIPAESTAIASGSFRLLGFHKANCP